MTSRTAWTAGNGVGYTWTTLINGSDLASLATAKAVLSTVADIQNQSKQDIFMDVSVRCQIASNTIAAGANLALLLYYLLDDGATYGDGQLPTPGTAVTLVPTIPPCATIPLIAAASQTLLAGFAGGIVIAPGSFRMALLNNSGFTLDSTAAHQNVLYRTYNTNLNS